jgi:hypothetical protein
MLIVTLQIYKKIEYRATPKSNNLLQNCVNYIKTQTLVANFI